MGGWGDVKKEWKAVARGSHKERLKYGGVGTLGLDSPRIPLGQFLIRGVEQFTFLFCVVSGQLLNEPATKS